MKIIITALTFKLIKNIILSNYSLKNKIINEKKHFNTIDNNNK